MINQDNKLFTKIINSTLKLTKEYALKIIIDKLKEIDNEVTNDPNRRNYHIHDKRSRWLWTPFGDIRFERTIFKNIETGEKRCLVDEKLGLVPYWYIQPLFFEMFISNVSETKSYNSLSKIFGEKFSTVQITRMIHRFNFNLKPIKFQENTKKLFINLDGMWLNRHKGKRKEFKFAICYTGSTIENRPKLLNKIMIPFKPGISSNKIAIKLEEFTREVYGDIEEMIFVGDGASWITEVQKEMSIKSIRSIDNFHYKFWFNKLFKVSKRSKNRIDWNSWLKIKDKKEFRKILLNKFVDIETGEIIMSKQERELFNKLVKWFTHWKTTNDNGWINAIEGIQSHVCSTTFKFKRSFSEKTIYKIMMINCAHYNNWKLTVDKENTISLNKMYNDEVINTTSWCGEDNISNIPHLQENKSSGLTIILNNLSH